MKDTILEKYQVRNTNREKTEFISYIKERLAASGYDPENDVKVEENGSWIFKSRNIVVGDLKEAKVVFTAHYDTCAVLPFPNFMAPTSVLLYILSQAFLLCVIFGMMLIVSVIAMLITGDSTIAWYVAFVFLYVLLFHTMFGYKNKHTANDNTSGVIAITKFLEQVPTEYRHKVCVVYFDNEEKGLLGSDYFKKIHKEKMKDKLLVNIDCVGDGRNVVMLAKKKLQSDPLYGQLTEVLKESESAHDVEFTAENMKPMMFPSDQMHFKKGVGVCALRKSPIGRYVARIHTPFDTRCREENIEFLADGMVRFAEKL